MNTVKTILGSMKIMCMVFMKDNISGSVSNVNLFAWKVLNELNLTTKVLIDNLGNLITIKGNSTKTMKPWWIWIQQLNVHELAIWGF
jgi:hypothetical protein